MMRSVKRLGSYYLNYPGEFSLVKDIFGYESIPRTLSLRKRLDYLEGFSDLRVHLIQEWINNINWDKDKNYFGSRKVTCQDEKNDREGKLSMLKNLSFRRIAASLMALKDIAEFDEPYTLTQHGQEKLLKKTNFANPDSDDYILNLVEQTVKDSKCFWVNNPGTGSGSDDEYDFVMKEIVSLLYVFRDFRLCKDGNRGLSSKSCDNNDYLLTTDTCFELIDRGFSGLLNENFGKHLTYKIPIPIKYKKIASVIISIGIAAFIFFYPSLAWLAAIITPAVALGIANGLEYPETENHVIQAYSSIYLARQWVKKNYRNDSRFEDVTYTRFSNNANLDKAIKLLLQQAAARVLHNDLFETNSRPYRAFTAHSLLNLDAFADTKTLRVGAQNALNFIWSKAGFQSFYGKAYSPFRRNNEKANDVSIYGTASIMLVAPFFTPKWIYDKDKDKGYWKGKMGNESGFTLWAMLLNYRPHEIITDFAKKESLFADNKGYWARFQARYTNDYYKEGKRPRYFESDTQVYRANDVDIKSTPEFCFVQKDFMNCGGGKFNRYKMKYDRLLKLLETKKKPKGAHEYDFLARPQVVFMEKSFQEFEQLDDMKEDVMFMLGEGFTKKEEDGFWLSDNSGIYKGFSYGYYHKKNGDDRHLDFPMNVPETWSVFIYDEQGKTAFQNSENSRVTFMFYDIEIQDESEPESHLGSYIVAGRVSKSSSKRKYRSYARGFWEIVPRSRFKNVQALKDWTLLNNSDSQFSNDIEGKNRFYIYTMTTGESLQLNDLLGKNKDINPIRNIWPNGATSLVDDALEISKFVLDHKNPYSMPLLEVREVDAKSRFTGKMYAFAEGDGKLVVTNPYMKYQLTFDSGNYKHPSKTGKVLD